MKKLLITLMVAGLTLLGAATISAQTAPKSVIHVVTVSWKPDTTPEQIKAALDGAQALPAHYKGITHVWTRSIKVQLRVVRCLGEEAYHARLDQVHQGAGRQGQRHRDGIRR